MSDSGALATSAPADSGKPEDPVEPTVKTTEEIPTPDQKPAESTPTKSPSSKRGRPREHAIKRKSTQPRVVRDEDLGDGEEKEENADDKPNAARQKKDAYINPDRVQTGGSQREKMSPEQLAERMERIRLQNDKIKEKRELVEADEQAFKEKITADVTQQKAQRAAIREKQLNARKIQEAVDNERELNAKRKLERMTVREWDMDKDQKMGNATGRGRGGEGWGFGGRGRGQESRGAPRGRGEGRGGGRSGSTGKRPAGPSSPQDPSETAALTEEPKTTDST